MTRKIIAIILVCIFVWCGLVVWNWAEAISAYLKIDVMYVDLIAYTLGVFGLLSSVIANDENYEKKI